MPMTDLQLLTRVLSFIDPGERQLGLVRRNGRILLGLPGSRAGALRALQLYQPQRPAALYLTKVLRGFAYLGLLERGLPKARIVMPCSGGGGRISDVVTGSCGILLGSPEHKTRRAIASYEAQIGWEVAKLAFGLEGKNVILGEARALESLPVGTPGLPEVLGLHCDDELSMLRLRYVSGHVLGRKESRDAISLLGSWISSEPVSSIDEYSEWTVICAVLSKSEAGRQCINRLSKYRLRPSVCHGDFARWNLIKQSDGKLIVLDWEWGRAQGMPGLDLVHYFAQDARLVSRLQPGDLVRSVMMSLSSQECRDYLNATGWGNGLLDVMTASIAYTLGTEQQANQGVLDALLSIN